MSCYRCIAEWANINTTCPTSRKTFSHMYGMDNEDDTVTLETIIIQTQQSKGEEEEEDQVLQELDDIVASDDTIEFEDNVASLPLPSTSPHKSFVPDRRKDVNHEKGGNTKSL
jgi:hypothetical protein